MERMDYIKERYLENDFVEIWFENGIVHVTFKRNTHLTLESAQKIVTDRMIVSRNTTTPICMDIRNLVSIDLQTHKFMASKEALNCISASAFVIRGLINRMLMDVFVTLFKPIVPTASFTDEEKAVEWLEKYKYLN